MTASARTHGLGSNEQQDATDHGGERADAANRTVRKRLGGKRRDDRFAHKRRNLLEMQRSLQPRSEEGSKNRSADEEHLPPVGLVVLQLLVSPAYLRQQCHVRHRGADEPSEETTQRELQQSDDHACDDGAPGSGLEEGVERVDRST